MIKNKRLTDYDCLRPVIIANSINVSTGGLKQTEKHDSYGALLKWV